MEERTVNQFGAKSILIERNQGNVYIEDSYTEEPSLAFRNGSYELEEYTPTIHPAIPRDEVKMILDWIREEADTTDDSSRVALLCGDAGIGKSVVMHDVLTNLQSNEDYLTLGIKSDQVEFVNKDDLRQKMHLAKPIEIVVKEEAKKFKRVVILIDQIDALSLSLSSNRTPLRSLINVVEKVKSVPNVRVVISCRPYDLEYDPLLSTLKIKKTWRLQELSKEQVYHTLDDYHRNSHIGDDLLRFLGNPLHLYLFLKIDHSEQLTDPLSTDVLYHQLWNKYVNDNSVRKVDKAKLLDLLDTLVEKMYERQNLSVYKREIESDYFEELQYLLSNGLIIANNNRLQFFHQTLFDYIYARRFVEKGRDLLSVLKTQHQGLFYRAAVKSILTFQRECDPAAYINIINRLLYAKNEDGKDTYRFHLKSLALSNMAYFETPLKEELFFLSRKVYPDITYMDVIFESVHTATWFNTIWEIITSKGGWKSLSKEYKEGVIVMCQGTLWMDSDIVLDKLDSVIDCRDSEDRKYLTSILNFYNINCGSEKLIAFYNKLVNKHNPLEYTNLLHNIIKQNPNFVCEELKNNVRLLLKERQEKYNKITVDRETGRLYEEILEKHHDVGIGLMTDVLRIVFESTQNNFLDYEIADSPELRFFQRVTGEHYVSNLIEDLVNIIIDDFLNNVKNKNTRQLLEEFSMSNHEGFVFIALYIYTSYPDLFKDDVYRIITKRQVLANAPSFVEYQSLEALRMAFPLMSDSQKLAVINRILSLKDRSEQHRFYNRDYRVRLLYGNPILDIDLHKGKALEIISINELRRLSWEAYQERQRIERKFNNMWLKNEMPYKMSCQWGWTALKQDQGLKMSADAWFNSMLAYKDEDPLDLNMPSIIGQCELFRKIVSNNPDRFLKLLNQIIDDDRIPLAYPKAGMQGLIDVGKIDEAMHVLSGILNVVNNDVNSTKRGFDIHSLLYALEDIIKQEHLPRILIRLLCNTLLNAKEDGEEINLEDKKVYEVGINQVRGHAGYLLVICAHDETYKEDIFRVLENVAGTASVYTRSAILLNMAILNRLDKDRNVILFKKLVHDYDPRLLSMPIHNYNPLIYFVKYAMDDLGEFFHHVEECPECYPEQIIIIWLAWTYKKDDSFKALLDKMRDTSQEARVSLLNFLGEFYENPTEDVITYILHLMEPKYDSVEMSEACSRLFHRINKWPDNFQCRIAETYVNSPMSKHKIGSFIEFLGGYAIKDPEQTLKWLERIVKADIQEDYIWNLITDVLIQSYNGIKAFNDDSSQVYLESAMDLIDSIMKNPNNKHLLTDFINKLDNE